MAGVKDVVEIDRGIAVVADGFWAAKQGREKLEIEKGKVLGSVDRVIEPGIQADFERALDQIFRGMSVLPPRAFMQDVASRWRDITVREVKRQIRDPLEKLFDEKLKE